MIKREVKQREIVSGYIYCLHDETNGICRIGKTKVYVKGRIEGQAAYYPFELKITKFFFPDHTAAETHLHQTFNQFKHRADWYKITPTDFNKEVKKLKERLKAIAPPVFSAIGEKVEGKTKYWRLQYENKEYRCEFVHVDFSLKIVRLRCEGKVVKVKFTNAFKYHDATGGYWIQGLALSKKGDKLVRIRFK